MVYDNHYAMSIRPIIAYEYYDEEEGEVKKTYSALVDDPIPVYQENRGETTKVTLEITDYLDIITGSIAPEGLTLYIDDFAMNAGVSYVPFPDVEDGELEFVEEVRELELDIKDTLDLSACLVRKDTATPVEADYLRGLKWESSDESVVAVSGGRIEALKAGTATISVTGSTWVTGSSNTPVYKTVSVTVSDTLSDTPKPQIERLDFISYDTLFAFNNDIDYSEIGITGALNYFGGNNNITFYPSEQVKLNYTLEPWNLSEDRYTLKWTSSNPRVATVDDNGVVTAESEGTARISLQISVDGKTSLLAARCSVTVKSEFIIENRTLIAYKGKGGDVVIPDDEGILTIGAYAFCHFHLDNEMEVEKDENGYYDLDLKKTPYGNKTVTSVVIPDGVETIEKYAFYNCEILREVTLPETCTKIGQSAFENCGLLESVNFDDVSIISDYAFYKCGSLSCDKLGGADLSGVYAVGDYAFAGGYDENDTLIPGARFDSLELTNLSRIGTGAFAHCPKLDTVTLGVKTRISKSMFEGTPIKELVVYSDIVSDYAFLGCTELESIVFKKDLTYLGEEAFSGCTSLEEVVFEGACEQISHFAFFECTALERFTLPDCEVTLGDGAFASSAVRKLIFGENTLITAGGVGVFDKVSSLTVDIDDSDKYELVGSALYTNDGTTLVMLLPGSTQTTFTVPAGVTKIADGAFSANTYITTVNASGSQLESIGYGAFAYCTALRSLTLPARAIKVCDSAFLYTTSLNTLDMKNVTSVGELAFEGSAITSANLTSTGVTIGKGAFYGCSGLVSADIGSGATIGELAFAGSGIKTVELRGFVTVSDSAFSACTKLTSFDFSHVSGKIGDYAFYGCTSLKSVNAPEVVEIGTGCFADCFLLQTFSAPKLEVIGDYAFAAYAEESVRGAAFETIYAPKLTKVGAGAFYMCIYLESIDLSKVTEIGTTAFAQCSSLKEVTLSSNLTELTDLVFYQCYELSGLDLSGIVRFGRGCLYGVILPSVLELPSAEYIGAEAFIEDSENGTNNLTEIRAPKVTYIGDQAFLGCYSLRVVKAPKLREIGSAAFAYTEIEEFEISDALETVGTSVFEGCESFVAFYTTVGTQKVYDKEYTKVMIKDGALYGINDLGYVLSVYPMAKTGTELVVADGTVRIEYCAAIGNKNITKVVLPESLRYIGNHAFYRCDNLETVVFKSYYAPILEGTLTGDKIEITTENVKDYPGFDKLYKYDYYFRKDGTVTAAYYYNTFIDTVGSTKAMNLTYVIPENNSGYDAKIYKAYFKASTTETAGTVMGPYAIAFIDAVNKLPEVADRFDVALIEAAINAYNALEGRSDADYIGDELLERFYKARREYNVSVAENKINRLFDIDNSKYSFDLVKDARATYLALTDAEKDMLTNALTLENKISDLTAAMGVNPDFSITYEEHFPDVPDTPTDPGDSTPDPEPDKGDNGMVKIVIVVASSVVGAAIVALAIVIFMKKRAARKALGAFGNAKESSDENEKVD